MPLSDEQSKQAYDAILQPEEEQPKYWDVHSAITLEFVTSRYGTKAEVSRKEWLKASDLVSQMNANDFSIEITDITEQGGE